MLIKYQDFGVNITHDKLMAAIKETREESLEKESVVRGHHIYKVVWTPTIREELLLEAEDDNEHDRYAVCVVKRSDSCVVGHVPCDFSRVFWFFLKRHGRITCRITRRRKLGVGLEVPCVYKFFGSAKMINKLRELIQ